MQFCCLPHVISSALDWYETVQIVEQLIILGWVQAEANLIDKVDPGDVDVAEAGLGCRGSGGGGGGGVLGGLWADASQEREEQ